MRRFGFAAIGVLAVAIGCGSKSGKAAFSGADAARLTTVPPATPGWDWPHASTGSRSFARETVGEAGDGYVGSAESRWQDTTKLSHVDANVFQSASAAHTALPAMRAFARKWARHDGGPLTDAGVKGLGEEAWRVQAGPASFGEEVTYGWRRRNLVVEVHIQCIFSTCQSDIGRAGRAWAEAIDSISQSLR
jgi:hypothetical protein